MLANINKLYLESYNFKTNNSKDINIELIHYANKNIDRLKSVRQLQKYINICYAFDIENGIFEYTLITITIEDYQFNMIKDIYITKLHDICLNLDSKGYIKNTTLHNAIMNATITAYFIAFMSPQELHPEHWKDIIKKQTVKEEAHGIVATDVYKCYKCKERKCKVTQMQTRSADEPITTIITCLVCYNVFTQ